MDEIVIARMKRDSREKFKMVALLQNPPMTLQDYLDKLALEVHQEVMRELKGNK